jgi:excisionase family DNA binding protein
MENSLITKENERVKSFFKSLDGMLDGLEKLDENSRPLLNGERLLTDKEVSQRLKVSRRTLQEYRTTGKIAYCQLGGKVLYRESDIQKMIEASYRKQW